mgnify:CR=1 FL=1
MTRLDKSAYNSPTKAYRFKCWAYSFYIDHVVNAKNDEEAQDKMAEDVRNKKIKFQDGGGFRPDGVVFITFEEVKNELTRVSSKETEIGTSMGNTSDEPTKSNT